MRGVFERHYEDSVWAALVAMTPEPENADDLFRHDIARCAWKVEHGDPDVKTDTQWIAEQRAVADAAELLWNALGRVDEGEPRHSIGVGLENLIVEANRNIRAVREAPSPRRKDNKPEVALFVGRLLGLWCHCGGELKFSRGAPGAADERVVKGPLIRFLLAATTPIFAGCKKRPLSVDQLAHFIKKLRDEERS
jgi:hypothetical protein